MAQLSDNIWKGQSCLIAGGGESLKSFDWGLLRSWHRQNSARRVIVVNCAILEYPEADAFFTEDLRVVQLLSKEPAWAFSKAVKVFHALTPGFRTTALELDPSLFVIDRTRGDKRWSRSLSEGLCLSSNSGVGAINLAHILGAAQLFLLGFDCRSSRDKESNYHERYERAGFDRTGAVQYENFRRDFESWVAPHVGSMSPVNLVTEDFMSSIECWPRYERDSFLRTGRPSKTWWMLKKEVEIRFGYPTATASGAADMGVFRNWEATTDGGG